MVKLYSITQGNEGHFIVLLVAFVKENKERIAHNGFHSVVGLDKTQARLRSGKPWSHKWKRKEHHENQHKQSVIERMILSLLLPLCLGTSEMLVIITSGTKELLITAFHCMY